MLPVKPIAIPVTAKDWRLSESIAQERHTRRFNSSKKRLLRGDDGLSGDVLGTLVEIAYGNHYGLPTDHIGRITAGGDGCDFIHYGWRVDIKLSDWPKNEGLKLIVSEDVQDTIDLFVLFRPGSDRTEVLLCGYMWADCFDRLKKKAPWREGAFYMEAGDLIQPQILETALKETAYCRDRYK